MNNFAKNLVTEHKIRFNQGKENVLEKREKWNDLAEKMQYIFKDIEFEIKEKQCFRKLYMINSSLNKEMFQKLPYLQFSFTQCIVGYKNSNSKNCTESGCELKIILLVNGSVICVLYPFKSELYSRPEEYLVVKILNSPNELKECDIKKLFEQLFSYAQISSVFGSPSWKDKVSVYQMVVCHWYHHFKTIAFLSGISKSLLYPIIRFSNPD